MTTIELLPVSVRLTLGHAAVQRIADRAGVDLLHIKGVAIDQSIQRPGRTSTDVDVLVRPSQVHRLLDGLIVLGWRQTGSFAASSAFEHSATLLHPHWGYVDVHRRYPGFELPDEDAFDVLWSSRREWLAAGIPCPVPSIAAQRLVVMLHAARSHETARAAMDIETMWTSAPPEARAEVLELVDRVHAGVAFAAALGNLDSAKGDRTHLLWLAVSSGGTRIEEWRARVAAAPTLRAKARLVLRAPLVNVEHLAVVLGHEPSRGEIVTEFFARPARGIRQEWSRARGRSSGS